MPMRRRKAIGSRGSHSHEPIAALPSNRYRRLPRRCSGPWAAMRASPLQHPHVTTISSCLASTSGPWTAIRSCPTEDIQATIFSGTLACVLVPGTAIRSRRPPCTRQRSKGSRWPTPTAAQPDGHSQRLPGIWIRPTCSAARGPTEVPRDGLSRRLHGTLYPMGSHSHVPIATGSGIRVQLPPGKICDQRCSWVGPRALEAYRCYDRDQRARIHVGRAEQQPRHIMRQRYKRHDLREVWRLDCAVRQSCRNLGGTAEL
jgi:hypothetical protein